MKSSADMPKLKISVNDQEVDIAAESDWVQWRTYIDDTFSWLASKPKPPSQLQSEQRTEQKVEQEQAPSLEAEQQFQKEKSQIGPDSEEHQSPPAKFPSFPKRPVAGERTIDYLIRAVMKLGGSGDKDQVYQMMLDDGFVSTSAEPVRGILDTVRRKYASLVSVFEDYFYLTESGKQLANQLLNGKEMPQPGGDDESAGLSNVEHQSKLRKRQNGSDTTIDLILRALDELGGEGSYAEIVGLILSYGWQTRSDTLKKQCETVSATIYDFKELVEKPGGSIGKMTPKGLTRLQEKREEDRLAEEAESYKENSKNGNPTLSLHDADAGLPLKT